MLLVERRLEGIHAIIGGAGKQTLTNVNLPQSISAHCRKPQILEAFNEDLFWLPLKKEWYGRQSWTTLLKHCMTPVGINCLPLSSRFQSTCSMHIQASKMNPRSRLVRLPEPDRQANMQAGKYASMQASKQQASKHATRQAGKQVGRPASRQSSK